MNSICGLCGAPHGYGITTTVLETINGVVVCLSCWQAFIRARKDVGDQVG